MNWRILAVALVLVWTGIAGQAQEVRAGRDDLIITSVDRSQLEDIVRTAGHMVEGADVREGEAVVFGLAPDGLRYGLIGKNCGNPVAGSGCVGLQMLALFNGEGDLTADEVNRLDYRLAAVGVWLVPAPPGQTVREVGVNRYLVLDRGQTLGNLDFNLKVFVMAANEVRTQLGP